jgi:hypothetical protein
VHDSGLGCVITTIYVQNNRDVFNLKRRAINQTAGSAGWGMAMAEAFGAVIAETAVCLQVARREQKSRDFFVRLDLALSHSRQLFV